MMLTDVSDTIHADSLALFALNIEILLADVTKPEKSKTLTLTWPVTSSVTSGSNFWPFTGSSRTGISNGVWNLEIGPVVWEISGGPFAPPPSRTCYYPDPSGARVNNRYQTTKVNNVLSRKEKVVTGVPQGPILGPLLFLLYIDDMPKILELGNFYIFADDTAVMVKAGSADQLQSKINKLLPNIAIWFQANRLTLTATKSNYQIFFKEQSGRT